MSEISQEDPNIEYVTLPVVERMVKELVLSIREHDFLPDVILAITPGGSMIGELLSYQLTEDGPIPMVSLNIQSERDAEGNHVTPPQIAGYRPIAVQSRKVLIVNDISRSGQTLEAAIGFVGKYVRNADVMTAVLFLSPDAQPPLPEIWLEIPPRKVVFSYKKPQT